MTLDRTARVQDRDTASSGRRRAGTPGELSIPRTSAPFTPLCRCGWYMNDPSTLKFWPGHSASGQIRLGGDDGTRTHDPLLANTPDPDDCEQ